MIKTLKDTVELMNSDDYRERFVAEYKQYKKIKVQKYGYGKTGYNSCFLRKWEDRKKMRMKMKI